LTQINPQDIADDLVRHLDEWYSAPETWDNELDTMIHEWYANAKNVWPKRPYFSPSAANDDPRGLYYKALRAEKDAFKKPPYQGRWQAIGTAIGDVIQRDILAMERNLENSTGMRPRFRFERAKTGEPMFEDFAKKNKKVVHNGYTFYLYGTCDGIMEYANPETGEVIRVGLEVKSKQTSAAKTSFYSMREPDEKHVKQCQMYGEMYNVDYYIILYVNTSKKTWTYKEGDYEKNPDIRAFGFEITQEDKEEVFDYLTEIQQAVIDMDPPELDPSKWAFNNYKTIIALEMTEEDVEEVRRKKNRAMRSRLPDFKKQAYTECLDFILRVRRERDEQAV
jgi:CRISPR/Cas system-associated exonuclease Cas4 (RecB family)